MKIAIMQPAFIPPASYFRLFAAADLFVILDDVQFDRRWYTHRQRLTNRLGEKEWLTLPIKKMPRDTTMIKDLRWVDGMTVDILKAWGKQLRKFPIFDNNTHMVFDIKLLSGLILPIRWLEHQLWEISTLLGVKFVYQLSSNIPIDSALRAQNRIIAICKKLGATEYINSSGGRHLYEKVMFAKEGINLKFLPEWNGSFDSILERLAYEKPENIRNEIYAQI